MLHFHDDLEGATAEFAKVFKRHTRQDWAAYAAAREFTHQPGCYDVVRHADAELLADGEAAAPARPALTDAPLPDLNGLGIKALKGLCADRGVDVSRCLEKNDIVDALRASAPAVAAPAAETTSRGAGAPAARERRPVRRAHLFQEKDGGRALAAKRGHEQVPAGRISPACIRAAYAALSAA